jgi:hypothetical protein
MVHASAHQISGKRAIDEHDVAVAACHPGTAEGQRVDAQFELVADGRAAHRLGAHLLLI